MENKKKNDSLGVSGLLGTGKSVIDTLRDRKFWAADFPYTTNYINETPYDIRENIFNNPVVNRAIESSLASADKAATQSRSITSEGSEGVKSLLNRVLSQTEINPYFWKRFAAEVAGEKVQSPNITAGESFAERMRNLLLMNKYKTDVESRLKYLQTVFPNILEQYTKGADIARAAIEPTGSSFTNLSKTASQNTPFDVIAKGISSLANAQAQLGLAGATDRNSKSSARTQEIANIIQLLYNPSEAAKAQAVSDTTNTYVDLLKSIIEANKDSEGAMSPGVKALYTQLAKRLGFDVNDLSGLFGNNIPPINEVMAAIGEQQEQPQKPTSNVTTHANNINQTPTVTQNASPVTINRGGAFSQEFLNNIDYFLKNTGLTRY